MRASSVFPTPDGPRKMNEPVGRFGSLMPARARRIAFDTATIAWSWPMTRLWSSSSMRMSFCDSASVSLKTGIPVHMETMSAISSSPISGCSSSAWLRQSSSSSFFFCVSLRSLSRSGAAFSNSWASIAASLSDADLLDLLLELAIARRSGHRGDADARAGLVDQVDRLVGEVPVLDVAVGEHGRGLAARRRRSCTGGAPRSGRGGRAGSARSRRSTAPRRAPAGSAARARRRARGTCGTRRASSRRSSAARRGRAPASGSRPRRSRPRRRRRRRGCGARR